MSQVLPRRAKVLPNQNVSHVAAPWHSCQAAVCYDKTLKRSVIMMPCHHQQDIKYNQAMKLTQWKGLQQNPMLSNNMALVQITANTGYYKCTVRTRSTLCASMEVSYFTHQAPEGSRRGGDNCGCPWGIVHQSQLPKAPAVVIATYHLLCAINPREDVE